MGQARRKRGKVLEEDGEVRSMPESLAETCSGGQRPAAPVPHRIGDRFGLARSQEAEAPAGVRGGQGGRHDGGHRPGTVVGGGAATEEVDEASLERMMDACAAKNIPIPAGGRDAVSRELHGTAQQVGAPPRDSAKFDGLGIERHAISFSHCWGVAEGSLGPFISAVACHDHCDKAEDGQAGRDRRRL